MKYLLYVMLCTVTIPSNEWFIWIIFWYFICWLIENFTFPLTLFQSDLKARDILLMIVINIQTEPIGKLSLLQVVTFQIFQDYTLLALKDWSTLFLFALSVKGHGLHVNLVKPKALFKVSHTTPCPFISSPWQKSGELYIVIAPASSAVSSSLLSSSSVDKNFNLGHNLRITRDRTFIFHMCIPCDKTFHIIP